MNIHLHQKCPRCKVPIGRQDTLCWACRHVVIPPRVHSTNVWLILLLKVMAAGALIALLLKYRTQLEGTLQAALRSLLKH